VYAKNYGVKFELSRNLLKPDHHGENELEIVVYSLKRTQTGLTRGPIAIMPSSAAFSFVRSVNVSTVAVPIFGSVVLIFLAMMGVILMRYHRIEDELSTWFVFYCFAAAMFLMSISETTREFLPIALSGWSHFFVRSIFDYSHFALAACYFFPDSKLRSTVGFIYAIPICALLLGGLASLGGLSQFSYQSGFDTAHAIMRYSAPLVFLPVAVGLWGSIKGAKESKLAIVVYALLVPAQLFDILVFHGVIRGLYFCKFYPMPLGIVFAYLLTRKYQLAHEALAQVEEAKNRTNSAIASLTGMLAHDVRKPFSILRMGIGMLGGAKDPSDVKRVLSRLAPEIDKAVSSVDGLISDVMEVGSTSTQLIQELVSPESLIESGLGDVFRVSSKADISVSYDLKHSHMVNVHVQKVSRVFSNILGNAIQAMKSKGEIWFKTTEQDGMLTFCVGNTGSVIPTENLPKLFDAFFTSGKKGGTGLGLAIAQKVVMAHGGRIWCESSRTAAHPEGQVEFFFTLPLAHCCSARTSATLPRHSSEIIKALQVGALEGNSGSVDKGELTLEADIVQSAADLGRTLRVLVVDDELVYRSSLAAYLHRTPELEQVMTVAQAASSDEALAMLSSETFDLIVTDVDLDATSLDGFELVATLRQRSVRALICVHSNRIVAADHRTAIASGADAFLPKPMARAQLLRVVLQSAEQGKAMITAATVRAAQGTGSATVVAAQASKPEVLVIDDHSLILGAWQDKLGSEVTIHTMTS
jgi:signal transduction histidine kinase/DNA-binding NarL/FixJ family response regulator